MHLIASCSMFSVSEATVVLAASPMSISLMLHSKTSCYPLSIARNRSASHELTFCHNPPQLPVTPMYHFPAWSPSAEGTIVSHKFTSSVRPLPSPSCV